MNDLLRQIEFLRDKMTQSAMKKGFTNFESIEISQELDRLLNQYELIRTKESQK
ncbi:Spo0E family sporulation regulatory protein-aspartic acid phosphatase [Virgibacillus ainsalahensis]